METIQFKAVGKKPLAKRNNLVFLLFPIAFFFKLLGLLFRLVWYLIFIVGVPIIISIWIQYYFEVKYGIVNGLSYTFSAVSGLLMFFLLKKIVGNCEAEEYYMGYYTSAGRKIAAAKKKYMAFLTNS